MPAPSKVHFLQCWWSLRYSLSLRNQSTSNLSPRKQHFLHFSFPEDYSGHVGETAQLTTCNAKYSAWVLSCHPEEQHSHLTDNTFLALGSSMTTVVLVFWSISLSDLKWSSSHTISSCIVAKGNIIIRDIIIMAKRCGTEEETGTLPRQVSPPFFDNGVVWLLHQSKRWCIISVLHLSQNPTYLPSYFPSVLWLQVITGLWNLTLNVK